MECKKIRKELVNYYYEEAGDDLGSQIQSHLETCKTCASSFNELKNTFDKVNLKTPEMSDAFWHKYTHTLHERIDNKMRTRGFLPRLAPLTTTLALLIFIILGGIKFYEIKQTESFVVRNYELLENFELIENLEFMQQLEGTKDIEKT